MNLFCWDVYSSILADSGDDHEDDDEDDDTPLGKPIPFYLMDGWMDGEHHGTEGMRDGDMIVIDIDDGL